MSKLGNRSNSVYGTTYFCSISSLLLAVLAVVTSSPCCSVYYEFLIATLPYHIQNNLILSQKYNMETV